MEWHLDEMSFAAACRAVQETGRADQGVGTMGEKTLHAVLKRMIEPDMTRHEVKLGRYTADVLNEQGVFEVQTRSVHRLKEKLSALLPYYPVTVVIPVIETKWLLNMDAQTGELLQKRKSPKRERPESFLSELVYLKAFLPDPNFSLRLVRLEGEEVRLIAGAGRRAVRKLEFAPTRFLGALPLKTREDYAALIPAGLPETFTAQELGRAMGIAKASRSAAANVLCCMDAIRRVDRRGSAYVYSLSRPKDDGCH